MKRFNPRLLARTKRKGKSAQAIFNERRKVAWNEIARKRLLLLAGQKKQNKVAVGNALKVARALSSKAGVEKIVPVIEGKGLIGLNVRVNERGLITEFPALESKDANASFRLKRDPGQPSLFKVHTVYQLPPLIIGEAWENVKATVQLLKGIKFEIPQKRTRKGNAT